LTNYINKVKQVILHDHVKATKTMYNHAYIRKYILKHQLILTSTCYSLEEAQTFLCNYNCKGNVVQKEKHIEV